MPKLERASSPRTGSGDEPPPPDHHATGALPSWRRHQGLLVGVGTGALVAVPLAIALVVLHSPRWYPLLDLAQAEMKVRSVASAHPPLLGADARIEAWGVQGSHPGPISWYMLWPIYALAGSSAWALQVATAASNLAAVGLILWLVHRRGGAPLVIGFGAALAVLGHLYGPDQLTEAWNPYLPMLWWFAFLIAVWSVLCEDLVALPVAVIAGSVCTQAHFGYLGLVGGIAAMVVIVGAVYFWRRRTDRTVRRRVAGWSGTALFLGVVLWTPPLIEQLRGDPGNISILSTYPGHEVIERLGASRGLELFAVHLNPWRLLAGQQGVSGAVLPGLGLVALWAGSVVVARRLGHRQLLRLHSLLALVLILSVVSVTRIYGDVLPYLILWAWGVTTLLLVAIGWTGWAALAQRREPPAGERSVAGLGRRALLVPGLIALVWSGLLAWDATGVEVPAAEQSELLGTLAPATVHALTTDPVPGTGAEGRDGRYLITWWDPVALGSAGQGLMLELERRGFDARLGPESAVTVGAHRTIDPAEASAEVHLAVGSEIERWRDRAGAREVAFVEPRTAAERDRYEELRDRLEHELIVTGRDDLAVDVDDKLTMVAFDRRVSDRALELVWEMAKLRQPAAVFVLDQNTGD